MSQDYGRQDFGNDILQERKRNPLVLVGTFCSHSIPRKLFWRAAETPTDFAARALWLTLCVNAVGPIECCRCCSNSRRSLRGPAGVQAGTCLEPILLSSHRPWALSMILDLDSCAAVLQGNADLSQKMMRARVAFQACSKSKPLTSLCASVSSRIRSPLNNCPLPSSHFEHPFYLLQAVTVALMAGSAGMYAISEGTKPSAKKNTPEGQL